jgi:glycosyltransferase involved in cell wall biosynthesis
MSGRLIKVVLDHQIFDRQVVGGISRQFTHLAEEIRHHSDIQMVLPFPFTDNLYLRSSTTYRWRDLSRVPLLRSQKQRRKLNRRCQRLFMALSEWDIFQATYYREEFLEHLRARPFVLMVPDMIPELFADLLRPNPHLQKARLIKEAAAVIVVSNATKRDLLRFHPDAAEKVYVIPLGSPPVVDAESIGGPSGDFLLFVGDRKHYKNFGRFSQAAARILSRNRELRRRRRSLNPGRTRAFRAGGRRRSCHMGESSRRSSHGVVPERGPVRLSILV